MYAPPFRFDRTTSAAWINTAHSGTDTLNPPHQVYGVKALQNGDGFPNAQGSCQSDQLCQRYQQPFSLAALNLMELAINVLYLYSTYVLDSPIAPLFGFSTNLMTLSKTILYIAQEYFCGFCNIGHNTITDLFFFYICTNW